MREFYRIRETNPGMTKVEALGQAQMLLLRGGIKAEPDSQRAMIQEAASKKPLPKAPSFTAPTDAPYAHPYYWAPFFLMGNWL